MFKRLSQRQIKSNDIYKNSTEDSILVQFSSCGHTYIYTIKCNAQSP